MHRLNFYCHSIVLTIFFMGILFLASNLQGVLSLSHPTLPCSPLLDLVYTDRKRQDSLPHSEQHDYSLVTTTSTFMQTTTRTTVLTSAENHAIATGTGSVLVRTESYTASSLTTNIAVTDTITSNVPQIGMLFYSLFRVFIVLFVLVSYCLYCLLIFQRNAMKFIANTPRARLATLTT
jgi:hypothetical protein